MSILDEGQFAYVIRGGRPIQGTLVPGGNKNAALPILAGTLLASKPVTVRNVPHLKDVTTTISLLQMMGAQVTVDEQLNVVCANQNFQAVFGEDYCQSKGAIQVMEDPQQVNCGLRIELAGRLIKDEERRLAQESAAPIRLREKRDLYTVGNPAPLEFVVRDEAYDEREGLAVTVKATAPSGPGS